MTTTLVELHPSRINPPKDFLFKPAKHLRSNETWRNFLDTIHITAEHAFFFDAHMGGFAHELTNLTAFEAEQVRQRWGEQLKAAFGRYVTVKATKRAATA